MVSLNRFGAPHDLYLLDDLLEGNLPPYKLYIFLNPFHLNNSRRAALKTRLAACANLIPKIESHYWWEGRIQHGREVLLVFKSSRRRLAALEKCIVSLHPYDTPEFIVLPINRGNKRYLEWLSASAR